MSEIKLNLIDAQQILCGTIHGSMGDACVAALSAEPESIAELEAALKRYVGTAPSRKSQMPDGPQAITNMVKNPPGVFASFHSFPEIDDAPWDAGILIIDLAARIVAEESTVLTAPTSRRSALPQWRARD